MRRNLAAFLLTASIAAVSGCRRNEDVKQTLADQSAKASTPAPSAHASQPAPPAQLAPPAAEEKPTVAITISKATTSITEPLRKNGYVDYLRALNQRFGQRVTPENNASVLLWKAVGPEEIRPDDRRPYFVLLGISPPAEKGDYLAGFDKYLTRAATIELAKNTGKSPARPGAIRRPFCTRP